MSLKTFNHVQIKVANLEHSRTFYNAVMNVLNYRVVLEIKNVLIGYGTSVHDMFEIRQANEKAFLSKSVHIAFNASNQKVVDNFYYAALEQGGLCNGRPGLRLDYGKSYYAAFVIDPDGHNIEAVYDDERK